MDCGGVPPGKGVGRGVAGKANTPFVPTFLPLAAALLPPTALLDVAFFSAAVAAFAVSSPVPVLFCCAHSGKAKSALITNPAHQLRIAILLGFIHRIPFDSRARLLTARCSWRTPLDALQLFRLSLSSLQVPTTPHTLLSGHGEKPEESKGRGSVRLFHNSLSVQLLPGFLGGGEFPTRGPGQI
jgi:hypothetical protein